MLLSSVRLGANYFLKRIKNVLPCLSYKHLIRFKASQSSLSSITFVRCPKSQSSASLLITNPHTIPLSAGRSSAGFAVYLSKNFAKNSGFAPGNGIINADGDLWKIQRKAGLRFFSNANLKIFIDETLPPLLEDTEKQLNAAAESHEVVDLQDILLELTTRLMGKMAYDVSTYYRHTYPPTSNSIDPFTTDLNHSITLTN